MKNHKNVSTNNFKIENLSEITEDIKKNQMEILELENIITKIKNSMDKLNKRMEGKEEKNQWAMSLKIEKYKWPKLSQLSKRSNLGENNTLLLLLCFLNYVWKLKWKVSVQFSSVAQSCPILCNAMNCSTPGLPVHHQLPELTQMHVHRVGDVIQPSQPQSSPFPPVPNPSQHQSLFQWVNSSHEVAKVLEFQLQHHSFLRTPRADLL